MIKGKNTKKARERRYLPLVFKGIINLQKVYWTIFRRFSKRADYAVISICGIILKPHNHFLTSSLCCSFKAWVSFEKLNTFKKKTMILIISDWNLSRSLPENFSTSCDYRHLIYYSPAIQEDVSASCCLIQKNFLIRLSCLLDFLLLPRFILLASARIKIKQFKLHLQIIWKQNFKQTKPPGLMSFRLTCLVCLNANILIFCLNINQKTVYSHSWA